MIPRNVASGQTPPWQRILARAVRDVDELWSILDLPPALLPGARAAARQFPLRIPRPYLARIRRGDPHDPLLRQFLPLGDETRATPGFHADPVGDGEAVQAPGLLQKYAGRALVIATGACPIHCRYCFRRHFPYQDHHLDGAALRRALARCGPVEELILSGGDPLLLSDRRLTTLLEALRGLPGLTTLRLHSRVPVTLPERLNAGFAAWLERVLESGLRCVLVLHANHPRELDETVAAALAHLPRPGLTFLNQTVLLRGVNDDADILTALSRRLFEVGVLPYYLHLLDPVAGAAHFHVPDDEARCLLAALRARLPGYLVPRLVREVPGAPNKVPVS